MATRGAHPGPPEPRGRCRTGSQRWERRGCFHRVERGAFPWPRLRSSSPSASRSEGCAPLQSSPSATCCWSPSPWFPWPPWCPRAPGPHGWGCPLAAELRIRSSCLWAGGSSSPDAKKPTWGATWASLGALLTAGHVLPTPPAAAAILTPPTANNGLKMNSSACCSRCHCLFSHAQRPPWPVL